MQLPATQTARSSYADLYAQPLVLSRFLSVAIVVACCVSLALCVITIHLMASAGSVKPLIVRINDVGRADVVNYDATSFKPQPPELRYFLTRFIVLHFGRQRANISKDYPASLFFLTRDLSSAAIWTSERSKLVEHFMKDPTADEITIEVRNVTLTEWSTPPFRAAIDFDQHFSPLGSVQAPRKTETFTAQVKFTMTDRIPAEYVTVNPLGLQISDLHVDQQF